MDIDGAGAKVETETNLTSTHIRALFKVNAINNAFNRLG